MKKTTSGNLSKKLTKYGAVAAVIGGVADASGQIVYTDIDPDEGGAGVTYLLDMDNNLNTDFVIRHFNSATYYSLGNYNVLAMGPAVDSMSNLLSNSILGAVNGNYEYPFAMNAGDAISAGNTNWVNTDFQTLNSSSCDNFSSNWCGVTDKYLGLRFKIAGNTHYGWARLDVPLNSGNWTIKDYAYNSVAGSPIDAGETNTAGQKDTFANSVTIVAMKKTLAFYNLEAPANYRVYNMTGQSIIEGETESDTYVVNNDALASGVYVVELTDVATGEQLRKKVML